MKKMRKLLALLVAMALVLSMGMMSFAAELGTGTKGDAKTITIKTPENLDDTDEVTYTVYKVFNATNNGTSDSISYQLLDGVTTAPNGFTVDDAGNVYLGTVSDTEPSSGDYFTIQVGGATKYMTPQTTDLTDTQIAAIADYASKVEVGTVTITGASTEKTVTVPDYGYYYITTTTGTVVTIDSTSPSAEVEDKNTIPSLDKKAKQAADPTYMEIDEAGENAIAQVGKVIPYEVTITVGKGAKGYVFHDTMDNTKLVYQNDLAITVDGTAITNDTTKVNTTKVGNDTITATFVDSYLKTIEGKTITITYSAKVSSDALSKIPAQNTAVLNYGEGSRYTTDEEIVKVYNAKLTVTKKDGDGKALAGAGFVIATEVTAAASGDAGTESGTGTEGNEPAETATSLKYYKLADGVVTWVDNIDDATEYTSGADGAVQAFTGLGPGSYILVEKTVPSGYNKAADKPFEIAGNDYTETNLEQASEVTNNAGSTLPSTGGIGTTIFYVVGAILVIGAGVILITRRRMDA